jgi:hypothetical protein
VDGVSEEGPDEIPVSGGAAAVADVRMCTCGTDNGKYSDKQQGE